MRPTLPAVVLLALLSGCGSGAGPVEDPQRTPAAGAYDGPMTLPQRFDTADVTKRGGAAVRALECATEPAAGGGGNYDTGPESLQDDAEAALRDFLEAEAAFYAVPDSGYAQERDDGDRVLWSYDVGGRSIVTIVVHDAVADLEGRRGWGVESWAACDPADLPEQVTAELGLEVWSTADGTRVPTSQVRSAAGPEHCDWQSVKFLRVGEGPRERLFLRDPDAVLADVADGSWSARAALPARARDTGWQREGRELWLTPEAAYVGTRADGFERWPAADSGVACA